MGEVFFQCVFKICIAEQGAPLWSVSAVKNGGCRHTTQSRIKGITLKPLVSGVSVMIMPMSSIDGTRIHFFYRKPPLFAP